LCSPEEGAKENFINETLYKTDMNTRALERIGLTKSEINVYLSLLQLGQSTAGPIVDKAGVTRSKIYDILERLKSKGLVSHIVKESTKYFNAADPHNIIDYLNKKEQEIKEEKNQVLKILPELLIQKELVKEKTSAEVFMGIRGMENAFNVMVREFEKNIHYYSFGAGKGENVKQIQLFFNKLHKERVKKKVKSFIIFNEASRGLFSSQERSNLVKVKYLMNSTPAAINMYKNYTIIALLTDNPITFLIRNKETADSFREYFKVMWKQAKK